MTAVFITHPPQGLLDEGGRLRGGMPPGRNLPQKFGDDPFAGGLYRTDQQAIVTQIEYV